MKKVILVFPDVGSLTDFVLTFKPSNAQVITSEQSLIAPLRKELIARACKGYGGILKSKMHFSGFPHLVILLYLLVC